MPDAKPEAEPTVATVRVRTRWPHSSFDSNIKGVPVIHESGTEIPAQSLEKVRSAAKASGVSLEEGS